MCQIVGETTRTDNQHISLSQRRQHLVDPKMVRRRDDDGAWPAQTFAQPVQEGRCRRLGQRHKRWYQAVAGVPRQVCRNPVRRKSLVPAVKECGGSNRKP
ncbi:MAG: hypothetical protein U1E70_23060 [Acetobacteraceae bacterium]